jgi:hypothetical protein
MRLVLGSGRITAVTETTRSSGLLALRQTKSVSAAVPVGAAAAAVLAAASAAIVIEGLSARLTPSITGSTRLKLRAWRRGAPARPRRRAQVSW